MQPNATNNRKNSIPKILIIDDEDRFRHALARQLGVREFNVLETGSGEDAIKIVRHDNPEVVILDQKMPGMDGIQTLREIKKIRPEVQVIMHTGHGNLEAARITGKHDVYHYLEKPCALEELIKVNQLYAFVPGWVRLVDNSQGFGYKREWKLAKHESEEEAAGGWKPVSSQDEKRQDPHG